MLFFNITARAEKIDYSSNIVKILENGKIISGEGDVQILVGENIFINSEKFEYNKETGIYRIFNNVQFKDKLNNIKASGSEFVLSTIDDKILSKKNLRLFTMRLITLILTTLNTILMNKK